jgi:hypothetical protein
MWILVLTNLAGTLAQLEKVGVEHMVGAMGSGLGQGKKFRLSKVEISYLRSLDQY